MINTELTVNIRVTVNDKPGIAFWRVRWAYRVARFFGLPLNMETESAK